MIEKCCGVELLFIHYKNIYFGGHCKNHIVVMFQEHFKEEKTPEQIKAQIWNSNLLNIKYKLFVTL